MNNSQLLINVIFDRHICEEIGRIGGVVSAIDPSQISVIYGIEDAQ